MGSSSLNLEVVTFTHTLELAVKQRKVYSNIYQHQSHSVSIQNCYINMTHS